MKYIHSSWFGDSNVKDVNCFKFICRISAISIKLPTAMCVCVCAPTIWQIILKRVKKFKGKNNEENILKEKLLILAYSW